MSKRLLVVLGNCGVGKSWFIREHSGKEDAVSGDGDVAVTKKTCGYFSVKLDCVMLDTVGLDKDLPNLLEYQGKEVGVVAIHDKPCRVNEFKSKVEKCIKTTPFTTYTMYGVESSNIPNISTFNIEDIEFRTFLPNPAVAPIARSAHKTVVAKQPAAATPSKQKSIELRLFGICEDELSLAQLKIRDLAKALPSYFVRSESQGKAKATDVLKIITTFENLKKHRKTGEKMLEYALYKMYSTEQEEVEMMKTNEVLASIVRNKADLLDHVNGLYRHQPDNDSELSDEKIADYIEAIYGLVYETKKESAIALLTFILEGIMSFTNKKNEAIC